MKTFIMKNISILNFAYQNFCQEQKEGIETCEACNNEAEYHIKNHEFDIKLCSFCLEIGLTDLEYSINDVIEL